MDKIEKLPKIAQAIKSTQVLESNYVQHLVAFMAMSKKLEETTKVLDVISKSLDQINIAEITEVENTKSRINGAISKIRNDFTTQINTMLKNPNYGEELKANLSSLLVEFKNIDAHTKPGITGGSRKKIMRGGKKTVRGGRMGADTHVYKGQLVYPM